MFHLENFFLRKLGGSVYLVSIEQYMTVVNHTDKIKQQQLVTTAALFGTTVLK